MLIVRQVKVQQIVGGGCNGGWAYFLPKLTLKMPDGGEVEFRDDAYDGAPLSIGCGSLLTVSRGVRWHATDGSGMVFINDVDHGVGSPVWNMSGVVVTRDGTRYRFSAGGQCTSITDRNGNKITIEYPTFGEVRYIDQLGRITTVKQGAPDPANPAVTLAMLVTLPGYQGTPRYFKIKKGIMHDHYRPGINPGLPVINGDWDPLGKGYAYPPPRTRLFPKSYGLYAMPIDEEEVLTEVVLPDNRSLIFKYNQFGEVAESTLPTGGKFQYDYGYVVHLPSGNSPVSQTNGEGITSDVKPVDRAVVFRRSYPNGTTLEGTWNYIYGPQMVNGVNHPCTQIRATSSSGILLLDERHFFLPAAQFNNAPAGPNDQGTHYALWSTGVEWRTETRDALGNILDADEQDWTQRASIAWSTYPSEQIPNDNRVNQQRGYLENGMMAKTETTYDQYNNPIEVREYDFDQTLKRRTTTAYLTLNNGFNYATNDSIHLISLPETVIVYDGPGNQKAKAITEYDVYTADGNRASLTDYSLVSQHDSSYGITKTTRGNATRIAQWLNTTGGYVYSYPRYDVLGHVVSAKDAVGNVTTVSFADDFGLGTNPGSPTQNPAVPTYAFPTLITSPPPLPGAAVHTAKSQYDYSTGLLTGFRDRNNVITQNIYNDPFDRPTLVKSALGITGVETHSATYYAPAVVFGITLSKSDVLTATDQTTMGDAALRSWTVTDGFGSAVESWEHDPEGDVKVITNYDALGRTIQSSNPFRPLSETAIYAETEYNLLGRVKSVKTPDNAVVTMNYVGNTVTVIDQSGKSKKSVTDALGRLIEVYEDPTGVNYLTSYIYSALDNLTSVTQGTQTTRSFNYDSLKRLISASNPESGTINYDYYDDGSLFHRTDARGVVSTYVYDAFGRNTTVNYSNTTVNPDITRFYDNSINYGKGRFWYDYFYKDDGTIEHQAVDGYDALGSTWVRRQVFYSSGQWYHYESRRTYNLAGNIKSQTYPSGHVANYDYNSAGRLNHLTGNLGDGTTRTYSTGITYASAGQLRQEQFVTSLPVYNKLSTTRVSS